MLPIKEGELISYNPLDEEIEVELIEDDEQREAAETIGYYASFEYVNGFRKTLYWSKKKMQAHAKKYSQGYAADLRKGTNWTFWSKDFDGMAMKTMLRQLISKWGVMSIDMVSAMDADMAVIKPDLTPDYVETETVPAQDTQEATAKAENPPEEAKVETPTPKAEKPQETAPRGPEGDAFAAAFFGGK